MAFCYTNDDCTTECWGPDGDGPYAMHSDYFYSVSFRCEGWKRTSLSGFTEKLGFTWACRPSTENARDGQVNCLHGGDAPPWGLR